MKKFVIYFQLKFQQGKLIMELSNYHHANKLECEKSVVLHILPVKQIYRIQRNIFLRNHSRLRYSLYIQLSCMQSLALFTSATICWMQIYRQYFKISYDTHT